MNTNNITQLYQLTQEKLAPTLRVWAYSDWTAWLIVILLLLLLGYYFLRHPSQWLKDKDVPQFIPWLFFILAGVIIIPFVQWTFHVWTTPELAAIKDILSK